MVASALSIYMKGIYTKASLTIEGHAPSMPITKYCYKNMQAHFARCVMELASKVLWRQMILAAWQCVEQF